MCSRLTGDRQANLGLSVEARQSDHGGLLRLDEPRCRNRRGKNLSGRLDGKLVALDQHTGKEVWSVQAERWEDGYVITSAPLYYDGMVITGFAGGEFAARGRVKAFSARSGKLIWTFYTVPGPGEVGHESWPDDNDAWRFGGATVWQTPAVDEKRGLLYFSTGNPGADFNGGTRRGDNLFWFPSLPLRQRPGNTAGTTNKCITTCGTTMLQVRSCCSISN